LREFFLVRWIVSSTGAAGAVASGFMGIDWLRDALRPHVPAAGTLLGEPTLALIAATALLVAMVIGLAGSMVAQRPDPRAAVPMLLVAGLVPGLLDPRAFVVTWLTCLAGLLATSLEPRLRRRRPSPVVFTHSTEELSLG
jgi:hypothetical protein